MKKIIIPIVGLCLLTAIGCDQPASTPAAATATPKAAMLSSGPEVGLLKKLMEAYAAGDWATYRSCFADTAVTYYNNWPLEAGAVKVPVDSVVANHKAGRENLWDGMSINEPIYEVVTDTAGNTFGHIWAKLSTKKKQKGGEPVEVTVFGSYGIKEGKLTYEWVIFDRSLLN